jgi:hydroxymethylglutaryl-CoA lyase
MTPILADAPARTAVDSSARDRRRETVPVMALPDSVVLRDVSLRDGLQDERPIPTDLKVEIFEALAIAGVRDLELTSFVRPDRVPALADAEALCAATEGVAERHGVIRWGLVLNGRGVERALAAGLDHLQYVVSVSDTHSRHNAGIGTDAAMDEFAALTRRAFDAGAAVEMTLATALGCPFEHRVDPARVVELARRAVDAGASSVGIADTIGVAVPTEVAALVDRVIGVVDVAVGVHLHDTRGLAIANAVAALQHGARRLDASVGGLGGCPFAPNSSGNVAIEDLAHGLHGMGVFTGVSVDRLVGAARTACDALGRPVASHIALAGPRFT